MIKEDVKQEYKESKNLISNQILGLMHEQAMTEKLFYKIYNENGKLVADSTMMFGIMESMSGESENIGSDYRSHTNDLTIEKKFIGQVKVYYPNNLLGEDFSFLHRIKQNIFWVAIMIMILSFIFSVNFKTIIIWF